MRSFIKNIFTIILLISLPSHLMTSKSEKNDLAKNKSSLLKETVVSDSKKESKSHVTHPKDINEDIRLTKEQTAVKTSEKASEQTKSTHSNVNVPVRKIETQSNHSTPKQSHDSAKKAEIESHPVKIVDQDESSCDSHSNSQKHRDAKITKVDDENKSCDSHSTSQKHRDAKEIHEDPSHNSVHSSKSTTKKTQINASAEIKEISPRSETKDNQSVPEIDTHTSEKSEKKLDDGKRSSIISSRSKYEKLGEDGENHVCKINLMSIYSVEGNHLDKAVKATPMEKSYCRRNNYTCCSSFNIGSISKYYGEGKKKLRIKFEVLEELLALFRGPKFMEYVQERKGIDKCTPIVKDMGVNIKEQDYGFFDLAFLRHQLEMAENLLMDTEIYVKKILWFYGDNICAICSPKVQDYFEFGEGNPKINVHINTCSERIEEREFERNLVLLYENFISKTMQFIQCTEGVAEEEEGTDPDANKEEEGEDQHEASFLPIDEEEKNNFLETFESCWNDQNVTDPKCKAFCKKNMRKYEFPINNLFHNFKVALGVMYSAMTGGNDIKEYYENIKELDWKIEDENEAIDFFPLSDDWAKYKMDNLEWEFHTATGHNVFKEIMSKKFTDVETSVAKMTGLFLSALLIFFA